MPAKPLTPEELADAARLRELFLDWQQDQKRDGKPYSQEAVVSILEFTQSAISQYLNGGIPLNVEAAYKFAGMLGKPISAFSQSWAEVAAKYGAAAFGPATQQAKDELSLACETSEEIGLLAAYRLAGKQGYAATREAYDSITDEFLIRVAAERKKL
jgi:transcriptional regulator with XRE-family HTH domain